MLHWMTLFKQLQQQLNRLTHFPITNHCIAHSDALKKICQNSSKIGLVSVFILCNGADFSTFILNVSENVETPKITFI